MQPSIDTLKSDIIARVNLYRGNSDVGRRSLASLAQRSGVSRRWLSLLVNGRAPNPTLRSLTKVHRALQEIEGPQQ